MLLVDETYCMGERGRDELNLQSWGLRNELDVRAQGKRRDTYMFLEIGKICFLASDGSALALSR